MQTTFFDAVDVAVLCEEMLQILPAFLFYKIMQSSFILEMELKPTSACAWFYLWIKWKENFNMKPKGFFDQTQIKCIKIISPRDPCL